MNEFLQSSKIAIVGGQFDPSKKFTKDWIPAGVSFEVKGQNAEFFHWIAPGKREFYLVPLEILGQVNPAPTDRALPGNDYVNYPRPHGPIPEGKKLIDDPTLPGLMKLVDVDADTRTDIRRIEDKLDETLNLCRAIAAKL